MVVLPINYVFYSNYKYNTNYVFKNNINKPKLHRHKDYSGKRRPWHKRSFCTTTSIIDRNLLFHNPFSYYQNIQIILLMQDHLSVPMEHQNLSLKATSTDFNSPVLNHFFKLEIVSKLLFSLSSLPLPFASKCNTALNIFIK